ncbi:MAG: 3-phosphoshikimate 1-carboxyvinyltransferase [Clostridia bacterium]|nr:3-phosphoshikimate 1-carboxyvinyltransferase [Clostridia bacterium]
MNVIVSKSTINGTVVSPPSKSYAHRLILASFLSGKRVKIKNVGTSKDVLATLNAVKALGASIETYDNYVIVEKQNLINGATINCDESGSTLRFLMPIIPALKISATLTGSPTLLSRPNEKLIECLTQNGAKIDEFNISGELKAGTYYIDASISSQYITGLLFALSILDGESKIVMLNKVVSSPYIVITLDVLKTFGVNVCYSGNEITIVGNSYVKTVDEVCVEGDWSGSAFILALGAINGKVTVNNLNVNSTQGDKAILQILKDFGAKVSVNGTSVTVEKSELKGIEVDIDKIPDLAQVISAVASYAKGKTLIKNIERLKIKESDRVSAIVNSLTAIGVNAKIDGNSIIVIGGNHLGGVIDGGNDHRTVMAAVVCAVNASEQVEILGAQAVNKSYTEFFEDFKKVGGKFSVNI